MSKKLPLGPLFVLLITTMAFWFGGFRLALPIGLILITIGIANGAGLTSRNL